MARTGKRSRHGRQYRNTRRADRRSGAQRHPDGADGRPRPSGWHAGLCRNLSPQAASNHLAKLLDGRMVLVETEGRHRYYRLARPEVAAVLEALLSVAPPIRSLEEPRSPEARRLRAARS